MSYLLNLLITADVYAYLSIYLQLYKDKFLYPYVYISLLFIVVHKYTHKHILQLIDIQICVCDACICMYVCEGERVTYYSKYIFIVFPIYLQIGIHGL